MIPFKPFIVGVPSGTLGILRDTADYNKETTANVAIYTTAGATAASTIIINENMRYAIINRVVFNCQIDINDVGNSFDLKFNLLHRGEVVLSFFQNFEYPNQFHGEITQTFDLTNPFVVNFQDILNYNYEISNSYPTGNDRNFNSTLSLRGFIQE